MDSLLPVFIDLPEKSQVSTLSKQRHEFLDVFFLYTWLAKHAIEETFFMADMI